MTVGAESAIRQALGAARRWARPGLWSIADQALVSGANFLLTVLFARWLPASDYGAVAVALSVFLLAANFHHALLLEPMSVLGPRHFADRLPRYFSALFRLHAATVAGLVAAVVVAAGLAKAALAKAFASLGVGLPLLLSFWFLRRICYVLSDPQAAVCGGVTFFACTALGAGVVRLRGWERPETFFLLTGGAALAASLALARVGRRLGDDGRALLPEALRRHWQYGRWMVGVSLTYWLANSAFPVLLGMTSGLAASGVLRAAENLVSPILQATGALSLLLLPWVAGQTRALGTAYLLRFRRHAVLAALGVTGGYLLPVVLLRRPLLELFYGRSRNHAALEQLVPVLALAALVRGVSDLSLSTALKGAARPQAQFAATVASSVFVCTGGWWLVDRGGAWGAALTMLASHLIQAGVLAAFFSRLTRGKERLRAAK